MCTAISYAYSDLFCGRTLDVDFNLNERVVITPRKKPLHFTFLDNINEHLAVYGIATIEDGTPLYYEAANEKGLFIAGLNFPENAVFHEYKEGLINIAPFELIPYILASCKDITGALFLLKKANIVNVSFSEKLPATPLHWFLSDGNNSYTIESTKDGLNVYENPVGVLTNNPPFPYHMLNLANYANLSSKKQSNGICPDIPLNFYSNGLSGFGLPGDFSSASRFVKACFVKHNSICTNVKEALSQFFHILNSVSQINGCVRFENGRNEKTFYTSCVNLSKNIFYYKTYYNSQINAVYLDYENLDKTDLICYPLITSENINVLNKDN